MSPCVECGFDFAPGPDAGPLVESFGGSVHVLFDAAPRVQLVERPEPGVWSALEYAAHTADAVGWYCDRVELVLAAPGVQLAPKDWDLATDTADYSHRSTERVLTDLRAAGARFARMRRGLDKSALARCGVGSDGSARSVEQLVARAVHEAVHHEQDIRQGLARLG